jgi:hypothetical protein
MHTPTNAHAFIGTCGQTLRTKTTKFGKQQVQTHVKKNQTGRRRHTEPWWSRTHAQSIHTSCGQVQRDVTCQNGIRSRYLHTKSTMSPLIMSCELSGCFPRPIQYRFHPDIGGMSFPTEWTTFISWHWVKPVRTRQ